ncbi:MAG TPA: hypothetical protein VIJ81_01620 [Sphingomicrobium sp.]|jgi:hypothetical protein|nr:hypothetical protein [Sphingomicrobium sp.]
MRVAIGIIAALVLIPAAAAADEKKTEAKDPNRIICEKQSVVGSRLATKRVCMTAAEWEIRRREDREAVEKAQVNRRGPDGS